MPMNDISDGKALIPFLNALNDENCNPVLVISEVLSCPGIYVFGELIDSQSIKKLMTIDSDETKAYLKLLNIFAYGTYKDYLDDPLLPNLTPSQELKLKQLTIVALAVQNRLIPYSCLQNILDISSVRELEDLIIACIYQGLCTGKMDHQRRMFQVDEIFGRDVTFQGLQNMLSILDNWYEHSSEILKKIQEKINWVTAQHQQALDHKIEFENFCKNTLSDFNSFDKFMQ